VFHGTDGDDWDSKGTETLPEIRKTIGYANRIGITLAAGGRFGPSRLEAYLDNSRLMEEQKTKIRLDAIAEDADEKRLIEGIRRLTAENGDGR